MTLKEISNLNPCLPYQGNLLVFVHIYFLCTVKLNIVVWLLIGNTRKLSLYYPSLISFIRCTIIHF